MKIIIKIKNTHFILFFMLICIFFPFARMKIDKTNLHDKNNNFTSLHTTKKEREFTSSNNPDQDKVFVFVGNLPDKSNQIASPSISVENKASKNDYFYKENSTTNGHKVDINHMDESEKKNLNTILKHVNDHLEGYDDNKELENNYGIHEVVDLIKKVLNQNIKNLNKDKNSGYKNNKSMLDLKEDLPNYEYEQSPPKNNEVELPVEVKKIMESPDFEYMKKYNNQKSSNSFNTNNPKFAKNIFAHHAPKMEDIITINSSDTNSNGNNYYNTYSSENINSKLPKSYTTNHNMNLSKNNIHQGNSENENNDVNVMFSNTENNLTNAKIYSQHKLSNNVIFKDSYDTNHYFSDKNSVRMNYSTNHNSNPIAISACRCEKLISCRPCGSSPLNNFQFNVMDANRIINISDCPCARKNICPPCPPASLIHEIAFHSVENIFFKKISIIKIS